MVWLLVTTGLRVKLRRSPDAALAVMENGETMNR